MAIEIQNGPAPVKLRQGGRAKFLEVYDAAQRLRPQEWFEWPAAPKAMTPHRKRLAEMNKDLVVFRAMNGRVIVKNEAEAVAPPVRAPIGTGPAAAVPSGSAARPAAVGRAQPLPALTAQQREAAAARVRQNLK